MNYYISDTHFFHKNIVGVGKNFDKRPYETLEEMHNDMKNKLNSMENIEYELAKARKKLKDSYELVLENGKYATEQEIINRKKYISKRKFIIRTS